MVKTAFKNSFSVLRKVGKRTKFGQLSPKPDCLWARVGSSIPEPWPKGGCIFVTTTKINVSAENLASVSLTKVEKSSMTFRLQKSTKSRKNPKLQDCQCLIPNGHNQLRVYPSATDSEATRWSHFACRITFWGDPLGQFAKKLVKNSVFSCITHIVGRNLK